MEDKLQVLQNVPLLATLGEELMKSLATGAEVVAVKKGDLVVREDDPGDALFAVVSGRLQAYTRLKSGRERVFATYCSGDYFGEMPLLSGETHWSNVRALNDSVLLKIPRAVFETVVHRDPRVAASVIQRMGHRIKELRLEKHRAKGSTIIAIYSAVPRAGKTTLARNLAASLARETREPVLLLDLSGRQRGTPLASWRAGESVTRTEHGVDRLSLELTGDAREAELVAATFGLLVKQYDYVLVDLPNQASPSVVACLLQADQVYVVVRHADECLDRTRVMLQDLQERSATVTPKVKIFLSGCASDQPCVGPAAERLGQRITCMLRTIPVGEMVESVDGTPYVLRRPMEPYSFVVRRLARELGNVLVGLALGCGAARGLSHIGVIRVLEREGIAVDLVAGSSIGALVAAAWAVGKTADEMEQIALQVKGRRAFLRLLDPMFPGSGIIRGMKVYDFLQSIVGDLTFEDTVIPLKIVASDINTIEEVVFEEGKLIEAIRASISIPGVFRPVQNDGHTLIDGGIVDPVPVNVLARAGVAKIIAVNTIPNVEEMRQRARLRPAPPARLSWLKRREKMHEVGTLVETPTTILNIYMRAMHAMQSHVAEAACANADLVIRPMAREAVWYDFYHPERYIRSGEEAAAAALPQLKELVRT